LARAPSENIDKAYELYKQDLSLTEIASRLNVPQGTVRSWKNRYKWDDECNATSESVATKKCNVAKKNKTKNKAVAKEVKQVLENPDLTDKQRLFCLYYVKSFNAAQSYLKAYDCSYETAMVNGSELLRNTKVRNEIQRLKELKLQQIAIGEEDMIEFHMRVAFADMGDYVTFGQEEVPVMSMFGPVTDAEGNEITKMVNAVKLHSSDKVDTQLIKEIKQGKDGIGIKLLDRCKSQDWLDRYFLMNPLDKHKIEYDNKKLELSKAKAQLNDDEESTESDGFIDALSGKVDEIWQEE